MSIVFCSFLNVNNKDMKPDFKFDRRCLISRCYLDIDSLFSVILRRATSSELPMAMRFRHLEKLSKEAVGVYR